MRKERTHYNRCQICGESIAFGWHCEACVNAHRVCQMCDSDISHRSELAQTCSASCKEARKRGMRSFAKGMEGNVPETLFRSVENALSRLDALEERIAQNESAVSRLVEQQAETNQQLQELNRNLSFFLTKLSNMPINLTTEQPSTMKTIPQSKPVTAPKFDDDFDFEITQAKDDGGKSSQNFFNSMMALQA